MKVELKTSNLKAELEILYQMRRRFVEKVFSGQDEDEQKNSSKHPAIEKNDPETSNGSSDCYQRMQTLKGECLRFRKEQLQDMPPPQKW